MVGIGAGITGRRSLGGKCGIARQAPIQFGDSREASIRRCPSEDADLFEVLISQIGQYGKSIPFSAKLCAYSDMPSFSSQSAISAASRPLADLCSRPCGTVWSYSRPRFSPRIVYRAVEIAPEHLVGEQPGVFCCFGRRQRRLKR